MADDLPIDIAYTKALGTSVYPLLSLPRPTLSGGDGTSTAAFFFLTAAFFFYRSLPARLPHSELSEPVRIIPMPDVASVLVAYSSLSTLCQPQSIDFSSSDPRERLRRHTHLVIVLCGHDPREMCRTPATRKLLHKTIQFSVSSFSDSYHQHILLAFLKPYFRLAS